MEPKKTEKADLTKKSGLFFSIGLTATMLIVVMAFSYTVREDKGDDDLNSAKNNFEEEMEPPITEQPPPPPPKMEQIKIIEIPDEEELEDIELPPLDNEITEDTQVEVITIQPTEVVKEDPNEIFLVVEETATPIGGMSAFYEYVGKKMQGKYPAQARRMGIEGRVFVQFVIEKDGSLTDVKAIKGIGSGCDELAEQVVRDSPKWKPGKQRGKSVRQRMVLPIVFKLN